jgi:hypothetical protein
MLPSRLGRRGTKRTLMQRWAPSIIIYFEKKTLYSFEEEEKNSFPTGGSYNIFHMGAVAPGMNIEIVKNKKIQTNMILFYMICVGVSSCDWKVCV